MASEAQVTKAGFLDMQVCVPSTWNDIQVEAFVNTENPSGVAGWKIRKEGHRLNAGAPERVVCAQRDGFVHIMLEC